jgi:hypothetical protein
MHSYSPYAGRNFPSRRYFGDTHLHTSFSMDADAFGARLGPKNAYRFAVAVSGDRKIDADGHSKTPVGNTVDVANATWTNTIGAAE